MGFGVTRDAIKGVADAIFSSAASDAEKARAEHVFNGRYITADITDGGTAGTAVTETVIFQCTESAVKVKKASVALPVAVVADPTDIITFTLSRRTGAGGATAIGVWATTTGQQGAITAFVPANLVLTAANVELAVGDVLTIKATKGGIGKAMAAATSWVLVQALVEEGS